MEVVVKGTQSIEQYKAIKELLSGQAATCYLAHRQAFNDWEDGNPVKVWADSDGALCVEYESGKWWHYKFKKNGLEWW